jgi:hypothetical protein
MPRHENRSTPTVMKRLELVALTLATTNHRPAMEKEVTLIALAA